MKKTILSVALATAVSSTLPVFADAAEQKTAPVSTTIQQTVLNKAAEGKATTNATNVNINFDVLGIANALINAANANTNREGFVKGLMESAFYETRFNGVKTFATVKYGSITYGVWVFENGSFTNKGDGGYINWAFRGWFDRNGGFVNFRRP
ncbi:stress protein [Bacillus sp. PPSBB_11]|uniref:stress protein n=1 Tax=Bacillus sp. PPSBB_11 TaxID=3125777 RepID=UPI0030F98505